MTLVYRPITGRFLNIDGTPKFGYIEFTPTSDLVQSNSSIINISTVRMPLDDYGFINGSLACTDTAGIIPTGWMWSVDEKIKEGEVWWMPLPVGDGSTIDISSLRGVNVAPPSTAVGPPGPPGPMGPPGGSLREVYTVSDGLTLLSKDKTDFMYIATGVLYPYNITMPLAAGNTSRYTIKRTANYNITVLPTGTDKIDGIASFVIAIKNQSIDLISNGSNNWMVV